MRVRLRSGSDDGAVAIMVAILAITLITIAAFTTDFGMAYAQRQALATGTDSAALAIVRNEYNKVIQDPKLTCNDLRTAGGAAASTTALTQLNSNAPFGATLTASQVTAKLECVGASLGTLQATVSVAKSVKTVLGGVAGVSTLDISRTSAAALGVANGVIGYVPIGVCTNQAQEIVDNAAKDNPDGNAAYRHELITIDKTWNGASPCGGGSGNWGWINCGGNGAPTLADGIQNGCSNPLTINNTTTPASVTAPGTPGNKGNSGPVVSAMHTLINSNTVSVLPVYSAVSGGGANVDYTVVGFLSVRICAYASNSKVAGPGACYVTSDPLVSNVANNVAVTSDSMQVQFVAYTPASQFSTLCTLGNKSCAFNAYLTKLIR